MPTLNRATAFVMKASLFVIAVLFCAGCAHTRTLFVQNDIRIVPPVIEEGYDKVSQTHTLSIFNDGGTRWIKITDATGKHFDVYVDRRIDGPTPGAIYLNAYPEKSNSVLVVNQEEFRKKIGVFD